MTKRNLLTSLMMWMAIFTFPVAHSQSTFVIVHGAWGGGWAFQKVDSLLTAQGYNVYRPTLTGQGERVHLAHRDVGLQTHINDVVNIILYEELDDIILVGHSYGGMVITGVADSLADRISKLIYLDAFLPGNGESCNSIAGGAIRGIDDGFVVPFWVPEDAAPPKDVPHPAKTFSDTLFLDNPARLQLPSWYILTVAKGVEPENDDFAGQADRAREKGWPVLILEADHNPQWSAPEAFTEMLMEIAK